MAIFVLVHGAWHGGWCWTKVEAALRELGHETHAPTLTGLGERSHLLTEDIVSDTHVEDIVNVLKWRELTGVILVGHSYGGTIITGAASTVPEKIRALAYLDAFAPEVSNQSLFATANPKRMAAFQKQIDAGAIALEPDDAMQTWTDDPATMKWLKRQCTPQPKATLLSGVTLTGREKEVRHRHYIVAERNRTSPFWAEYLRLKAKDGWTSERINTLHDAMIEAPDELAARLDAYATSIEPNHSESKTVVP
ncbi:MAG: alpha/beta hydrolase family protein [Pseudomonadota bacterium]